MIQIKNISGETLRIVTRVDESAPGCRVKGTPPLLLIPGEAVSFLGYEPGISLVIEPETDADRPRSLL